MLCILWDDFAKIDFGIRQVRRRTALSTQTPVEVEHVGSKPKGARAAPIRRRSPLSTLHSPLSTLHSPLSTLQPTAPLQSKRDTTVSTRVGKSTLKVQRPLVRYGPDPLELSAQSMGIPTAKSA
jgi:hypothetical protein